MKNNKEAMRQRIINNLPFKVKVTPEQSREVQELVIACGKGWHVGGKIVQNIEEPYLVFDWMYGRSNSPEIEGTLTYLTADIYDVEYFKALSLHEFILEG